MLLALSFPKFGHPAFAWVALVPLLLALNGVLTSRRPTFRRAFTLGIVSGLVYFSGTVYWISEVMVVYGGLSWPASIVVNGLLVTYLALFPGLFALSVVLLRSKLRNFSLFLAPAVWVTTELGRMYLFGGFPWELLGYSQTTVIPIAQLASVFGVHGLSALVVLINSAITHMIAAQSPRRWVAVGITFSMVAVTGFWGSERVNQGMLLKQGTPLRVGLLQGNVEQTEKWNPALKDVILNRYLEMNLKAAELGAEFVIWPEASVPFFFEDDRSRSLMIRQLAKETETDLLIGSNQFEQGSPSRYYNAAFLVNRSGETAAVYRKIRLVPFGEYVPLRKFLFFVSPLIEIVSDLSSGISPVMLPVSGHMVSTAICYEVIYPNLTRNLVLEGSELLTTITNDAWYGKSSGPYQHFQQATLRAIEQGRYLVRAANTGISGIVDPYGRVVTRTALFEREVVTGEVRLLTAKTIYGRTGDLFAYLCVIATFAALLAVWSITRAPILKNTGKVETRS